MLLRRIFFLGVLVGAVALLLLGIFMPSNSKQGVRKASMETASPLWRFFGGIQHRLQQAKVGLSSIDQLEREVDQLRLEHAMLSAENATLKHLQDENLRLRELIGFRVSSPYKLLAARVVQYDPSNWWQAAIIDRGWADNPDLASDQPVITPRGVVGKVGVVGKYSSRIVFLTDENCRISVEVEETRARGILSGAGLSLTGKPQAKISFVSRDTPLPIGARVFSSGLGGVFPQGLLVGTVREAPPLSADLNFGLYREGKIEPIVDLDNLKEVFIIVGAP